MKIKWKVDPEPVGRYRSFEHRNWPSACFYNADGSEAAVAAMISCKNDYDPHKIKRGDVFELTLRIADHSKKPWKYVAAKKRCATIKECKDLLLIVLTAHPHLKPASL